MSLSTTLCPGVYLNLAMQSLEMQHADSGMLLILICMCCIQTFVIHDCISLKKLPVHASKCLMYVIKARGYLDACERYLDSVQVKEVTGQQD